MSKCGYIAILGAPNAGKSTLLNAFVGQKISIVTPKVQTTRFRVRGICMERDAQMIFVDTPGVFKPKREFERSMVDEAWAGLADADAALVMVDAYKGFDEETQLILDKLEKLSKKKKIPVAIALNKIDSVEKTTLFALAEAASAHSFVDEIFMISAIKKNGLDSLRHWLSFQMPEGPYLYPEDQLTDMPMRLLAAEITREKLFMYLRQELPYSITVETETWETRKNGTVAIAQAILVERENQKIIVIGKGGEGLKRIGMSARKELERQLETKVHLTLFVKIQPDWRSKGAVPQQ